MANLLKEAKRREVILLHEQGVGIREIARKTGCHRSTVINHIGRGNNRHSRLVTLGWLVVEWAEKQGFEWTEVPVLLDLLCEINSCPRHPEAIAFEDVDDKGCRFCVSDGLKQHHARRKAEGRPILPPRRKPAKPPERVVAPEPTPEPVAAPKLPVVVPKPPNPVAMPKSEPAVAAPAPRKRTREDIYRHLSNDSPLRPGRRLCVCDGRIKEGEVVHGKVRSSVQKNCERCSAPMNEWRIVEPKVKPDPATAARSR